MAVSHFEIIRRAPFAFDYERIDGTLHFAVDPVHPANARITDLHLATRAADGRVHFSADLVGLQPADPARGSRRLLSYVVNRGQRTGGPFNRAPACAPTLPPTDEI